MTAQSTVPVEASSRTRTVIQPEGIIFGDVDFTEPRRYPASNAPSFLVPEEQGIYAILVPDDTCGPRPYAVLYFGEARDMSRRITREHEKFAEWLRKAGGRGLYYAWHPTMGFTYEQRREAVVELIKAYKPSCNVHLDAAPTLRGLNWLRSAPPAKIP